MIDQTDLPAQVEQAANQRALTCLVCFTRSGLELAVVNPSSSDAAGACNAVPKANSEIMERPLYGDSRVCPLSKEASDQIVSGQEEMPLDAFGCT